MTDKDTLTREEQDFVNALAYHKQLLSEITSLFKVYCSMCGEHAIEMEEAMARAIFFTLFGSIEASCRVLAASTLFANVVSHEKESASITASLTCPVLT